jgi:hypothetical protein
VTYHLRAFLGADDATLRRELTDSGSIEAVLGAIPRPLSGPARAALGAELSAAAGGLLEEDLGSILLAGLMGYHCLVEAARETAADPDVTRLVALDDHLVQVTYEPHIDVLVDRDRVYELALTLSVSFTVQGLAATVRAGHLVHVRIWRCEADVRLSWQDHTLLRRGDVVDAPLLIRLGSGIPVPQAVVPDQARGTARVTRPRSPGGMVLDPHPRG